jgi:hypothetical protein
MNEIPLPAAPLAARPLLSLALKIGAPLLLSAATGAALYAAEPVAPAPVAQFALRYDAAMDALRHQRYSAAYGRFAALADQGHAPSALMALAMVTYRPTMVDPGWEATPGQLRRWTDLAMEQVRERAAVVSRNDRGE